MVRLSPKKRNIRLKTDIARYNKEFSEIKKKVLTVYSNTGIDKLMEKLGERKAAGKMLVYSKIVLFLRPENILIIPPISLISFLLILRFFLN